MRRIMIVGCPGAGKTTLALALGRATGLPVFHTDRMFWRDRWSYVPPDERQMALARVFTFDGYVLEGSYPGSYTARLADCDTLIWLDVPIWRRAIRVWRRIRAGGHLPRPDLAEGCVEADPQHLRNFWRHFWLDADKMRADQVRLIRAARPGVQVHHLDTARAVARFEAGLHSSASR